MKRFPIYLVILILMTGCASPTEAPTDVPTEEEEAEPAATADPFAPESGILEEWNTAVEQAGERLVDAEDNPTIDIESDYQDLKGIQRMVSS